MVLPEIQQHIIDELAGNRDRNHLITEICEMMALDWDQAEALVESVQAENEAVIARRRLPLLVILALAIFVGGLLLTGYGVYGIVLAFTRQGGLPDDLTTFFMPVIEEGIDPVHAMGPAVPLYLRLLVYFVFSPFSAAILGIAMIYGSLVGMREVWFVVLFRK
jgi:hypothetical protein